VLGVARHDLALLVGHVQRERRAGALSRKTKVLMSQQWQVPDLGWAPRQFFTGGGLWAP
jgi:hypothetical protein